MDLTNIIAIAYVYSSFGYYTVSSSELNYLVKMKLSSKL